MSSDQAEAFWDFSLHTYARAGVEDACLSLQFDHGLDVNVVLFCVWTGERGISFDRARFDDQIKAAIEWQKLAVSPVRDIRLRLKEVTLEGLSVDGREELRGILKTAELHVEKLEQSVIVNSIDGKSRGEPSAELADGNFDTYWELVGRGDRTRAYAHWHAVRSAVFAVR